MAAYSVYKNICYYIRCPARIWRNSGSCGCVWDWPGCSVQIKFVCCALVLAYGLSFNERTLYALALLPGEISPPNYWVFTVLTHNLLEVHWWLVVCDILLMLVYGRQLQLLWGDKEMFRFYVVINLFVPALAACTYFILYYATQNSDLIFDSYLHGMAGNIAGLAVALKQTSPDCGVVNIHSVELRHKSVPAALLCVVACAALVGVLHHAHGVMCAWGLVVSWVYLRFYQRHPNERRGDEAEHFSFASFFPRQLQPFTSFMAMAIFSILTTLRICRQPLASNSAPSTSVPITLTGVEKSSEFELQRLGVMHAVKDPVNTRSTFSWPSAVHSSRSKPSPAGDTDRSSEEDSSFVLVDFENVNSTTTLAKD